MSTIPPNWMGSIIQTQGAKASAAEQQQRQQSTQTDGTSGGKFANQLQNVIEAADADSAVYEDAEGAGSQGRPFEGGEPETEPESTESADEGGDEGGPGLDLQA